MMPNIRWDGSISTGNIITILCGVLVAIAWFASIESANAKRDEKIFFLEKRVSKNEGMSDDIRVLDVKIGRVEEKQDITLELLRNIGDRK